MRVLVAARSLEWQGKVIDYLRSSGCQIECAYTGEEALSLARHYDFDVAVVAIDLPDMNGDILMHHMRARRADVPILTFSPTPYPQAKFVSLRTGADDVMELPVDLRELMARLHALVRRNQGHSQPVLSVGTVSANLETHDVTVSGKLVPLTRKETAILELLMLRRNSPLSKETFLNQLYSDADQEPDPKIIDVFVCKLRKKLANAGASNVIETVWGRGYMVRWAQEEGVPRPIPGDVRATIESACKLA